MPNSNSDQFHLIRLQPGIVRASQRFRLPSLRRTFVSGIITHQSNGTQRVLGRLITGVRVTRTLHAWLFDWPCNHRLA